ncbi:hypothetical protein A8144_00285 [Mycobacterium leprae 3125609]|nr:hypothetical protein A8144_00285 [Mycobacterium leprae 3125609]OAX72227.1 hypothetical protein A3216_00345 [Mycobacterium leprae 7935681]
MAQQLQKKPHCPIGWSGLGKFSPIVGAIFPMFLLAFSGIQPDNSTLICADIVLTFFIEASDETLQVVESGILSQVPIERPAPQS